MSLLTLMLMSHEVQGTGAGCTKGSQTVAINDLEPNTIGVYDGEKASSASIELD